MNKIFSLACGVAAMALVSCSSDEPENKGGQIESHDGDVYASLTLRLPSSDGARAGLGESVGEEFGKDSENNVGKILVVLADKSSDGSYKVLTSAQSDAMPTADSSLPNNQLKFTINFKSSALSPNAPLSPDSPLPGKQVYVFVYCNPTSSIINRFSGNLDEFVMGNTYEAIDGPESQQNPWKENSFLMTNCEISGPVTIPSREQLVNEHNVPEKAFPLGTVKVKRVCARFDYATSNATNSFTVKSLDGTNENMGVIKLTHMALFNIQKEFFHLPRTSNTWKWSTSTVGLYNLCGDLEGYVMSYNPNSFKNGSLDNSDYQKYYFANLINNSLDMTGTGADQLEWVSIDPTSWNSKTEDNDEGWTNTDNNDYRIWRYCTENTIPAASDGSATASQRYGITTGVVFKAEFDPADKTVWDGDVIYVHNNIVYGDFKELLDYVTKNPDTNVAEAFKQIKNFTSAQTVNPDDMDLKANLLDGVPVTQTDRHGFKAYPAAADGKYYMYYFYFNRHKTNGIATSMGENEFGVVRNNVYKLKVTNIRSLGEPKAPTNPDTPDEQESAYFTVSCVVMPWTVRINNIEF